MHANGVSKEADLEGSYSPVCLVDSLRITVVLAIAFGLSLSLIDVANAGQNTILIPEQMPHMHPLPFYLE